MMENQASWHWRVNCGPGIVGLMLNGQRFLIHTVPTLEQQTETDYVMTIQIQVRTDGAHHRLEVVDVEGNAVPLERLMRPRLFDEGI